MTTDDIDFNDPSFKQQFWEWFDALPRTERDRFKNHSADMAELYFYNKYYRRMKLSDSSSVAEHFVANEDVVGSIPTYRSKT